MKLRLWRHRATITRAVHEQVFQEGSYCQRKERLRACTQEAPTMHLAEQFMRIFNHCANAALRSNHVHFTRFDPGQRSLWHNSCLVIAWKMQNPEISTFTECEFCPHTQYFQRIMGDDGVGLSVALGLNLQRGHHSHHPKRSV